MYRKLCQDGTFEQKSRMSAYSRASGLGGKRVEDDEAMDQRALVSILRWIYIYFKWGILSNQG